MCRALQISNLVEVFKPRDREIGVSLNGVDSYATLNVLPFRQKLR